MSVSRAAIERWFEHAWRRRSTAELLLAYAVWGLGLGILFWDPGDLVPSPSGSFEAQLLFPLLGLIYFLLIQLPLAIRYDEVRRGSTGSGRNWQFAGVGLFQPRLVHGLFVALFVGIAGVLAIRPFAPPIDTTAAVFVLVGYVVFLSYFPAVVLSMVLFRWGRRGLRRLFEASGSSGAEAPSTESGDRTERESTAESSASGADSAHDRDVRFASLLVVVLLPTGAGWFLGQPEFGVSVASLLLTAYEISHKPRATG